MKERKCIYCGATYRHNDKMCGKCRDKYPLVKELVALFKTIKKECGQTGGDENG